MGSVGLCFVASSVRFGSEGGSEGSERVDMDGRVWELWGTEGTEEGIRRSLDENGDADGDDAGMVRK